MEKKRKEIEESERRLRNKDADVNDAQRERQHFNSRLGELGEDRARQDERNRQIDGEIAAANEQIAAHTAQIAALDERQKEFSGELDELRGKRADVSKAIHESELNLMKLDADRERITAQVAAVEERARTLGLEIEMLKQQVGEMETDLSLKDIEGKIAEADGALRKIGAVNMLAIEEYEKVDRQVGERTERKETLSTEMTFAVQPRDKKVHLLNSLSGGEKSLTTLAFIFSIQRYIPAPFYAFDEVDMSLDGANVERIASMVTELAPKTQFIIISLRKPMIEAAQRIMGVTLRPDKSTLVTGVKAHVTG